MRPDFHGDLDAIEALLVSEGYRLVVERITEEIERKRDALEREAGETRAIPFQQGFLSACRMFLSLPEQIISEIQPKLGGK